VGKADGSRECASDGVPTMDVAMVGTARRARLCPPYDCCVRGTVTNIFTSLSDCRRTVRLKIKSPEPAMSEIVAAIAVLLALTIAIVLLLASRKPDTFKVQRTAAIQAPPEKIFPLIADFHQWRAWSPYEDRDPDLQRSYSGAASGRGAVYAWEGNRNVGSGRMEILDAPPPSKVVIKLDFLKPFEGHNTAEFTFVPQGDTTNVTWLMHGPAPLISKVMQVFMNMDNMIGKDFAAGLANLKRVTET
jgi:uncharacterized protein YndB with AHSA1/START domain